MEGLGQRGKGGGVLPDHHCCWVGAVGLPCRGAQPGGAHLGEQDLPASMHASLLVDSTAAAPCACTPVAITISFSGQKAKGLGD